MNAKKIVSLFLSVILILSTIAIPISSASIEDPGITPHWTHTAEITIGHENNSGTAECEIYIQGYPGTTKIDNVNIELQIKLGTTFKVEAEWKGLSATGDSFNFYDEVSGVHSGYTYRLIFMADVHRNGTVETVGDYLDVVY